MCRAADLRLAKTDYGHAKRPTTSEAGPAEPSRAATGIRTGHAWGLGMQSQETAMPVQKTLCIIKPDAVGAKRQGEILQLILNAGFEVVAMRQARLTREMASAFYDVHRDKPFYGELVDFMTSGPVVIAALRAEDAVNKYRQLLGATNPAQAAKGTIRQLFGTSIDRNAAHGSDSPENGERETQFFFAGHELD